LAVQVPFKFEKPEVVKEKKRIDHEKAP